MAFEATPKGYRPQELILPYDTHGRIALLGARYETPQLQWGPIQGGIDEHFARAKAGLELTREDFLAGAQREFREETLGGDISRIVLTDHTIKNPGMRSPRDGFTQGKFFYVAGIYVQEPRTLQPNPEHLKGRDHRIDWVTPEQVIYRLRRYEAERPRESILARPVTRASKKLLRAA